MGYPRQDMIEQALAPRDPVRQLIRERELAAFNAATL